MAVSKKSDVRFPPSPPSVGTAPSGGDGNRARLKRERRHQEEALDEALKDTFPASDPVYVTGLSFSCWTL
jgi:hypothetical protein